MKADEHKSKNTDHVPNGRAPFRGDHRSEGQRQGMVAVVAVLLIISLLGCAFAQVKDSLEYKLAVINKGGFVREDDLTVARFRSLLNQLSGKYPETRQQIADMSVKTLQLLKEDGISQPLLEAMEGLNTVHTRRSTGTSFAKLASAYVALRNGGQSHSQAISGLRALLGG